MTDADSLTLADPVAETAARVWLDLRVAVPDLRSVVVTGCRGGEGATTFAASLARAAQQLDGKRVLLIEANVFAPALAARLSLPAPKAAWCEEANPLGLVASVTPGFDVLPSPARRGLRLPADGLLADLRDKALKSYDLLVWDTRAVSASLDTKRLIGIMGRVVLITESDATRVEHVSAALNDIQALQARAVAVIRNRAGRNLLSLRAGRD